MPIALLLLALLAGPATAQVSLPNFFSDHMVLQADRPIAVWGRAGAAEKVRVEFDGEVQSTEADADGRWSVRLAPRAYEAEGRDLVVFGEGNRVEREDVLVGEVWLCSGQSNMVWRIDGADGAEEARAGATDGRVRMFTGGLVSTPEAQEDLPGTWRVATPETVGRFSATAYYFGRKLLSELDVPVGLINVSWGGSNVEAWTSLGTLREMQPGRRSIEQYELYAEEARVSPELRAGMDVDDSDWEAVQLPALFEDLGHDIDGVMWFRRRVELPAAWRGRPLSLELGAVDDEDHTFVNGIQVGHTNGWDKPRRYEVAAQHTSAEILQLAVRVRDGSGPGGFHADPASLRLYPEGEEESALALAGPWRARVTSTVSPPAEQHRPAHLYHGMLHPLRDYAVRGVIWYQGENNAIREMAYDYAELFPAFVRDLRARRGAPDLPFVFVQLPNFAENDSTFWNYHVVREAQLEAYRELENVGMAITTDIGDPKDIHPRNKLDVGLRLARWALNRVYEMDEVVPMGPIAGQAEFAGGEVRVPFETFGSSLALRDGTRPTGFQVAGEDGLFHPGQARLEGNLVVVRSPDVATPNALRYGWANNPMDANLVNAEGLPASPFRASSGD